jgi:hypothetical protein
VKIRLTLALCIATIALAVATIAMIPIDGTDGVEGSVVAMVLPLQFWIGLWSYRVGSVAVIAGTVFYVVKIAEARRRAKSA